MHIDTDLINSRKREFIDKLIGSNHFQTNIETINFTLNSYLADNVAAILAYCTVAIVLLFILCACVCFIYYLYRIICAVDADE